MNPKTTLVMGVGLLAVFATLAILKVVHAPTDEDIERGRAKVIPELHDVEPDNLTQVAVTRDKETLEFNYVESGDRWQMVKPLDVLAQTSAVRDVFFDLKNLARRDTAAKKDEKAGVFTPKSASDLVEYGLDSPASSISVTFKPKGSEKPKSVTLQVGAPTADKDGLYVKLADEKFVFVVNKSNLRSLEKKIADFRQQKLVTVGRFDSDMIRLGWPDRTIAAEKQDSKWRLTEPVADRADTNKVEELIGKLGDLKADGDSDYIEDAATDLAKYGLDSPQLVAEIRKPGSKPKADDKKKSKDKEKPTIVEKVLIGKPVEGRDDKVYAKLEDQKYVIAVSASIFKDLDKQLSDLRSHDLVEVTQADVDYVRVQSKRAGEIALKKDFEWEIVQPKTIRAEQSAVTELVRKIDELDIKEFLDQADRSQYGLEDPAVTVAVWQKGMKDNKGSTGNAKKDDSKTEATGKNEPTGDPIRVYFGKIDDEKKLLYVRRGDDPTVFAVSSEGIMDIVDRGYLAYRRKQVLSFSQTDVSKLVVRRSGKTFSAEHKKLKEDDIQGTWRLVEPVDAPGDSNAINRLLGGFARLNAKNFVTEEEADLKTYGLDEPRIRATATLKQVGDKDPEQHVLLIGNEADDGAYYAKVGTENTIFTVDRPLVDDLNGELHDRIVLKFDASKLDGIALTWADGKRLELANKKAEGEPAKSWTVANDETLKLDTRKVTDLVNQLTFLTTERFAQYAGDFADAQGLIQPALQIEVKLEGESEPKKLRVGALDGDQRYVAIGDKAGAVALIPDQRWKDLLVGPAHFAQQPDSESSQPSKPGDDVKQEAKPDSEGDSKSGDAKSEKKNDNAGSDDKSDQ
jgi:hypothetical protein